MNITKSEGIIYFDETLVIPTNNFLPAFCEKVDATFINIEINSTIYIYPMADLTIENVEQNNADMFVINYYGLVSGL